MIKNPRYQHADNTRTGAKRISAADLLQAALQHYGAGRLGEAEVLGRQVLKLQRDDPDALHLLGMIALRNGHLEGAVALLRRATARQPKNASALSNLGIALKAFGRVAEAVAAFEAAARAAPHDGMIYYNLGNARLALGDFAGASAAYRQAVACDPTRPEFHNNLGMALEGQNEFSGAMAAYAKAVELRPTYIEALHNLGNSHLALCRPAQAIALHRRALALEPGANQSNTNIIFALNFDPAAGPEDHQRERRRWGESHAQLNSGAARAHPNRPDPDRRIRIGYVSGHFRHQAATYAFAPVILGHDPKAFEVFCYSDTAVEDELTGQFRAKVEGWRQVVGLADDKLAEMIRADEIDILVDLVGHMSGHRLLVFARKPAPVQVTGWGEPTGTGLSAMDYLFADPVLVPPAIRSLLTEQVVDLPCFLCCWSPSRLPPPGPLPALQVGHVTFGSFNRPAKLSAAVLQLWAALLHAVPGSRLILKSPTLADPAHESRIRSVLGGEGIAAERLTLIGNSARDAHFSAYQRVDLALDPFPHSGGMTTLDALAMGVPVLTLPGATISSRLAAACLASLDLADFIASDRQGFLDLAVAKATDLAALARLRQSLPDRLTHSPAGNGLAYAQAVESAYRTMWRRWCTDRAKAS